MYRLYTAGHPYPSKIQVFEEAAIGSQSHRARPENLIKKSKRVKIMLYGYIETTTTDQEYETETLHRPKEKAGAYRQYARRRSFGNA